jgi:hypothetical protein
MATSSASAAGPLLVDHHASPNASDASNDDPHPVRTKRTSRVPSRYDGYILEPPKAPKKAPSAPNAPRSRNSSETNSIAAIHSLLANMETKIDKLQAANDSLKETVARLEDTVSRLSSPVSSSYVPTVALSNAPPSSNFSPPSYASAASSSASLHTPPSITVSMASQAPKSPPSVVIDLSKTEDSALAQASFTTLRNKIAASFEHFSETRQVKIKGLASLQNKDKRRILLHSEEDIRTIRINNKWIQFHFKGAKLDSPPDHPVRVDSVCKESVVEENSEHARITAEMCKKLGDQNPHNGKAINITRAAWLSRPNVGKRYGSMVIYLSNKADADWLLAQKVLDIDGESA